MAPAPTTGAPPALSAFLRGVGRRALLFAALQAGEGPGVDAALIGAARRFAAGAAGSPMGAWPSRFWGALVAALPRPDASTATRPGQPLPGLETLAALGSGGRTAMLLALVAGLDEEDGGAALGVDAATWRLALRRAAPRDAADEFDESAWRALAAAVRDAQRALPEARLAWWEHVATAALEPRARAAAIATHDGPTDGDGRDPGHRTLRVLWAAVAACALGLAATFLPWRAWFHGEGTANPAPSSAVELGAADSPDARYDAEFALRHHPDLPRLLAGEDALLRESGFGAWYAARRASGDAALPAPPPAAPPAAIAPQPLPAFDALSPAQLGLLGQRAAAADALPRIERGELRERWEAWQRLPASERDAVRAALAAFAALPEDQRQALREEYAGLPGDLQHGWLLGPALGARWPLLQPLLQQVPADEREPLLAHLHAMDPAALDAFAAIARRTPPQARDALRRELAGLPRR